MHFQLAGVFVTRLMLSCANQAFGIHYLFVQDSLKLHVYLRNISLSVHISDVAGVAASPDTVISWQLQMSSVWKRRISASLRDDLKASHFNQGADFCALPLREQGP